MPPYTPTRQTIADLLTFLGLSAGGDPPRWPPDAFAVAAIILQRSDTYRLAVDSWPPDNRSEWSKSMKEVGVAWRAVSTRTSEPLPPQVLTWWNAITSAGSDCIGDLAASRPVVDACLQLLAASDEASSGVGVLDPDNPPDDEFSQRAMQLLAVDRPASTLCVDIDSSKALVLPKMRTPQVGMSLRSLSHHLAYCDAGEVAPRWDFAPKALNARSLNILLLPWPLEVAPRQFRENQGTLANMKSSKFRFFTCETPRSVSVDSVRSLVASAERIVGRVDALIFPELALPSGECVRLAKALQRTVIGGEGTEADPASRAPGTNAAVVAVPLGADVVLSTQQEKHHRWRLDKGQIGQYGIGSQLHPAFAWWEYIKLGPRQLRFWCLDSWLAFCVLICEDLARQDPVAPIVRAVGPNLVISLVMDGPQLASRWTARYATVLAEDPGASVLSLTSAGMVRLSRAPGKPPSRVVALWKDGRGGSPHEIELEKDAEAVVLCLTQEMVEEWTADGRGDDEAAGHLLLNGVHQVYPSGVHPSR